MLSKLLKHTCADLKPLAWRRLPPTAASIRPGPGDWAGLMAEVAELRGQLADTTATAEEHVRQSYDQGFRAGETAARAQLETEVRAAVEQLASTAAEVAQARAETVRRAEADTVRLALEIARRILHRELSVNSSALEELIKAALEKLQNQEIYRVRVHPDQETVIQGYLARAGRGQNIAVVADPMQGKGGAVFEISRGELDASLDTQLGEIERVLADQLEARP